MYAPEHHWAEMESTVIIFGCNTLIDSLTLKNCRL